MSTERNREASEWDANTKREQSESKRRSQRTDQTGESNKIDPKLLSEIKEETEAFVEKVKPRKATSEGGPEAAQGKEKESARSSGNVSVDSEAGPGSAAKDECRNDAESPGASQEKGESRQTGNEPPPGPLPARLLNEFVYCPRLFYFEYVEKVFVENADTVRGKALHRKVDSGSGAMPAADAGSKSVSEKGNSGTEEETIHSRSVTLTSDRLGVTAKMDLVEVRVDTEDLFSKLRVSPVDYKAGSPKEGEDGNAIWDTDQMQLGLQCLILRDNGYLCDKGLIYYRGTKQRVALSITQGLEKWIEWKIAEARQVARGPIPAPLESSPKCPRCSLVTVCLPDETQLLQHVDSEPEVVESESEALPPTRVNFPSSGTSSGPRRLIATRDDALAFYLNSQKARVGCSSETLEAKEDGQVIRQIRLNNLHHVALFGNAQISTQAIQQLCRRGIPVTYFSSGGWFYGMTHGHKLQNVLHRIEQFRAGFDANHCLDLARRYVHGKIRNQRTILRRNHMQIPSGVLGRLKMLSQQALGAESLDELLGVEGAAAAAYFKEFNGMLKQESDPYEIEGEARAATEDPGFFKMDFNGRNRRPPRDPVNALLSLAYSILVKDCTIAAHAVGLDPYFGFFHQPRFGRPALALDVMEEFRPLIADSVVLTLVNNRMVTPRDFVSAGNSVNLTTQGRKLFYNAYEKRMSQVVTHPLFDYKVSYRRTIELQFRILARGLSGEIQEYIPFVTR